MIISSNSVVFFHHQNKAMLGLSPLFAMGIQILIMCHALLSPTVARLAGTFEGVATRLE
jgi:hypothetical protein